MKITLYDCDLCGKRFEVKGDAQPLPLPAAASPYASGEHFCRECVVALGKVTYSHRRELSQVVENLRPKTEGADERKEVDDASDSSPVAD